MNHQPDRRQFIAAGSVVAATLAMPGTLAGAVESVSAEKPFEISLAQWSLHRSLQKKEMDNLDFAKTAKELGIDAVEYVNSFFKKKANDTAYLDQMKKRCEDNGVKSLLIMVDGEGKLGAKETGKRKKSVENHHKEQVKLASDGLRQLSEFAAKHDINVIVENHGGLSSNGQWLAQVIRAVDMDNCGTLPDFGNFWIERPKNGNEGIKYDRYVGVSALMPFAKAVSAKSYAFDVKGNETMMDYERLMQIVFDSGYRGHVGIEFEGKTDAKKGIVATRKLLERCREKLSKSS